MNADSEQHRCEQAALVPLYALRALPSAEACLLQTHLKDCPHCQRELESLRSVVEAFVSWPVDILRPSGSMWDQLQNRIGGETLGESAPPVSRWCQDPEWEDVAPGISCKLLATDTVRDRVSMLVRLAPGASYPPHRHTGVEELFLLYGELWIEDRRLYPGDYNRGEAGATDKHVWSETGCTCILITSPSDVIT